MLSIHLRKSDKLIFLHKPSRDITVSKGIAVPRLGSTGKKKGATTVVLLLILRRFQYPDHIASNGRVTDEWWTAKYYHAYGHDSKTWSGLTTGFIGSDTVTHNYSVPNLQHYSSSDNSYRVSRLSLHLSEPRTSCRPTYNLWNPSSSTNSQLPTNLIPQLSKHHFRSLTLAGRSVKLLLALASTVILGFGPLSGPTTIFYFQDF
jgi:hypothetical protein